MTKLYKEIFSVQNKGKHKLIRLFGIKIKFKRRKRNYILSELNNNISNLSNDINEKLNNLNMKLDIFSNNFEQKFNDNYNNIDWKLRAINNLNVVIFEYLSGIEYNNNFMKEREIVFSPERAPIDHYKRYQFAQSLLNKDDVVADIACACGYGSSMLAQKAKQVLGVDISQPVVNFANKVYKTENLNFVCQDAQRLSVTEKFDKIVSFETIEHIPHPQDFLKAAHNLLKDNGLIICSVPNETVHPHSLSGNNFHYRHYTEKDFIELLENCGFKLVEFYHQYGDDDNNIMKKKGNKEGGVIVGIFQKS